MVIDIRIVVTSGDGVNLDEQKEAFWDATDILDFVRRHTSTCIFQFCSLYSINVET